MDSPAGQANFFFGDTNSGGTASEFRLSQLSYGRLVDVDGLTAGGVRRTMARDFVINQNLVSDDLNYELSLNGVTGQETLLIRRNVDDAGGREQFLELLKSAGATLDPIQVQDLTTSGTFSMLPRNSALVLRFDDLLLPSTVTDRTIELLQGYPPTSPFEARVFPSGHYGGLGGDGNFYPSRVIVDMTSSLVEQQLSGSQTPLNGVGLPPSVEPDQANIQLRIPTVVDPSIGLTRVLTNLTDHELATVNNGPVDFTTNTRPVTRAVRSGGRPGVVDDPFNGFLRDTTPPRVIGATPLIVDLAPVQIREDPADVGSLQFILPEVTLPSELCGRSELGGFDVISQAGLFAQVVKPENLTPAQALAYRPDSNGKLFDLPVELVSFPREWVGPSDWQQFGAIDSNLETLFESGDSPECFVQMLPRPSGFPNAPTQGAATASILSLKFSEPMDPDSLTAFDSVTLTRVEETPDEPLATDEYVVGELTQAATLREVTFVPILDLAHVEGAAESYFFNLANDANPFPPKDLAGNVVSVLPTIPFTIDAAEPSQLNGGRVSRFSSTDEEFPTGNEWGGQIIVDANRQVIRARPVIRSQVVIDNLEQALPAQMTPFLQGVQTPFSTLGSKMQTLWRYSDCGFSLTDPNAINIDVEGLWWSPAGGNVTGDSFNEFEIRLAHSRFAPDELIDPDSLFPQFPNSGLRPVYTVNVMNDEVQQIVHPKQRGYTISQGDVTQTSSGTTLVPMPLNRGIPDTDKRYFTWRDSRIRTRTGVGNGGLESEAYLAALGLLPPPNNYYRAGRLQTIGLPLLMEFRTSADLSASGQNAWVLNLAVNSSSRPYFRAFSTGGVNTSGNQVFIDPENETSANGGFSPGGTPPGDETFGRDNTFHLGALDYVARVSLSHSIWFEAVIPAEGPTFTSRSFSDPTFEPGPNAQPNGTSVSFGYRGATAIEFANDAEGDEDGAADNYSGPGTIETGELADYQYDAFTLDLYGDYWNDRDTITGGGSPNHDVNPNNDLMRDNFGLTFLTGTDNPEEWRDSVQEIAGARYYQVRMTFIGNPITGQSAEVSAFALTWEQ